MGKILAIDWGEKRVGYAISDETQTVAFPRGIWQGSPQKSLFRTIGQFLKEENISLILIGAALSSDNEETIQSQKSRAFGEKLFKKFNIPVISVDEFGTSDEALSKIPSRADRIKKTGNTDTIAAQIILQRYLDSPR
ncbi:MAG: Holliday junction resolvase RuvX [Patescibacteria group bacterium]